MKRLNPSLAKAMDQETGRSPVSSGQFQLKDGAPAVGVRVRLDLEPSTEVTSAKSLSGVGVEVINLDQTTTGTDGSFAFTAPLPSNLKGYQDEDGTVSLLVTSLGDGPTLLQHIRAIPPKSSREAWSWRNADVDSRLAPSRYARAASLSTAATAPSGAIGELRFTSRNDVTGSDFETISATSVDGCSYCHGSYFWVRSDSNVIKTKNRIQGFSRGVKLVGGMSGITQRIRPRMLPRISVPARRWWLLG